MTRRLSPIVVLLATAAFALTACAGTPQAAPDSSKAPDPVATSPQPSTPAAEPVADPAADPSCDTIIPASIVEEFESVGWTVRAESFRIADIEIPEGLQCIWGDFSTATDHVQIFGWAPISDSEAASAQRQLTDVGWRTEETADGLIVTESPETTIATDADGYGLTYLFGDGWVKHADTKQSLLLVVWPAS